MKKISVVVCVCAVLFSFNICGEDMGVVSAQTPGAEESLEILQDIIREDECQVGMAFLGYIDEAAEAYCYDFSIYDNDWEEYDPEYYDLESYNSEYYAVGDNVVYYYDVLGDAWLQNHLKPF